MNVLYPPSSLVLPEASGAFSVAAQEWPHRPGPREIAVHVCYPGGGLLHSVGTGTGVMLSLHNWGGTAFVGTAAPEFLTNAYDVIAVGVDYLQSGPWNAQAPWPYDHGWLQALDTLRALYAVLEGLRERGIRFASERLFAAGGSGGGNVALMANKLAPNTFAAVVDLCGMKKLGDSVAFDGGKGCNLDARYSRDPASPCYIDRDGQELRFLGHPGHLAAMRAQGCAARIFSVHGVTDDVCRFDEACEFADHMAASGLDFTFVPVTKELVDGIAFLSTGHDLGNRTRIVHRVAGHVLSPRGPHAGRRNGPHNFALRGDVRYATPGGEWVVDYTKGAPAGRFERREEE